MKNLNSELSKEEERNEIKKSQKRRRHFENEHRVLINKEAHDFLEGLVLRSNNGFDGGEITKSDLLNWLICNSAKSFSDSDVNTLRGLHFNEKKMLFALLRNSQDGADFPDDLKKVLRAHFGVTDQSKRRGTKVRSDLSTAAFVGKSGAA